MKKVFTYKFKGISPNSVCFKYAFFSPCEARYQRSSGEGSELRSEEAGFKSWWEQYCFRFVRS